MKRIILLLSAAVLMIPSFNSCKPKTQTAPSTETVEAIPTADNSRNSIEWEGVYSGTIPCADCEGIEVRITLKSDLTYQMEQKYIPSDAKPEVIEGSFQWDENGSNIILGGISEGSQPNRYKVGENKLFQLDMEGNMISGEMADNYVLDKIME